MKKLVISLFVLLFVVSGAVLATQLAQAQTYPSSVSGASQSTIDGINAWLLGLAAQYGGNTSGSTGGYTPPPATPASQLPAGYNAVSGNAGDFTTLTGAIINGNHGGANDYNFRVWYPGGGTLTGTELSGIKNWNGFWSALWVKSGGGAGSANRAIYADGPVTIMNGNVGIGIESPYSQDKLHVAGNIRADDTIVASKGLCVGGGTDEFRCTNDGNQSGTWCGIQHTAGFITLNSFPCKGVPFPGCPTGYAYTVVGTNAYNIPDTYTCMKTGTGYP